MRMWKKRGLYVYFLLLLATVAVLLRFVFSVYAVSRTSMNNSLFEGDRMMVLKYRSDKVRLNDIVVFRDPSETYIKRCLGRPGDRIEIRQAHTFINGTLLDERPTVTWDQRISEPRINLMTLNYYNKAWNRTQLGPLLIPFKGMRLNLRSDSAAIYRSTVMKEINDASMTWEQLAGRDDSVYVFKKDYYFMVGDNRSISDDSRTQLGLIAGEQIIGTTSCILYSTCRMTLLKRIK